MDELSKFHGKLGRVKAAHLLRRASFYFTKEQLNYFQNLTADEALNSLFTSQPLHKEQPIDPASSKPWINTNLQPKSRKSVLLLSVSAWWLDEARRDKGLQHKMEFFLHTFLTINSKEIGSSKNFFDYLHFIKQYATGNFKDLIYKISLSNAMLKYLDNGSNNKNNPNENYARELLELFTIGRGDQNTINYTEQDIVSAAKVLTGYKTEKKRKNIDPETGIPIGRLVLRKHDTTDKQFSSAFQNRIIKGGKKKQGAYRELSELIAMIFEQKETAKHFCRRLYRFFVRTTIDQETETNIIQPLADLLYAEGYNIQPVVKKLLGSQHFYDVADQVVNDEVIGSLLSSPIEHLLRTVNYFEMTVPEITISPDNFKRLYLNFIQRNYLPNAGMILHRPETVAGYDAYFQSPEYTKNWFTSSTLLARYKLSKDLSKKKGKKTGNVRVDMVSFVRKNISNPKDAKTVVRELTTDLLPLPINEKRFNYFLNDIFLDGLSPKNWQFEWENYLKTQDDSDVVIPLNKLFQTLIYSQEYQCN